jgi:hypothetical protein
MSIIKYIMMLLIIVSCKAPPLFNKIYNKDLCIIHVQLAHYSTLCTIDLQHAIHQIGHLDNGVFNYMTQSKCPIYIGLFRLQYIMTDICNFFHKIKNLAQIDTSTFPNAWENLVFESRLPGAHLTTY